MTDRERPLAPNVILAVLFVAFIVIGVVTVLLPELSGESEVEGGETPTPSEMTSSNGDTSE